MLFALSENPYFLNSKTVSKAIRFRDFGNRGGLWHNTLIKCEIKELWV